MALKRLKQFFRTFQNLKQRKTDFKYVSVYDSEKNQQDKLHSQNIKQSRFSILPSTKQTCQK